MTCLRDIAHVRSGDKGDTAQISVIAYSPEDFEMLAGALNCDRIATHLRALPDGVRIDRLELPSLGALLFTLEGALAGGVTRSLAIDAHGKTLAMQLLDLKLNRRGQPDRAI